MGAKKIALTIIVSIILTTILVALVNVGTALFFEKPNYEDYCSINVIKVQNGETTEAEISDTTCMGDYDKARADYNQIRYYIFAGIGFVLLLVGLFVPNLMIQLTGLSSGLVLVTQGLVMNFDNKLIVFISLFAILIIFGIVAWRVIKKLD